MIKHMFVVRDRESHVFVSDVILADSIIAGLKGFVDACDVNSASDKPKIDSSCYEFVKIGEIAENGKIVNSDGVYIATGFNCKAKLDSMIDNLPEDLKEF